MPSVYGALDLNKNELRQAQVQNLTSAPSTPVKGQLWMDSTNNVLKWYDGTQWIAAQAAAGAIPSDTVSTAAIGDLPGPGSSTLYSRGDHKHAMPQFAAPTAETTFGTSSGTGVATTLAKSDHTHGNPVHDAAAHAAIPISALAAATGTVNIGSQLLSNVGNPAAATDAATKSYVDNAIQGLDVKASVKAASTANLTLSGTQTVDGIALVAGDRILVKDQSTASGNGIYVVAAGAWTRSSDANTWNFFPGAFTFVEQGTVNAESGWVCTSDQGGTLGTTNITWVQFSGAGQITAGSGLTKTGNSLDVVAGDSTLSVAADSVVVNTAVIATVASLANYAALASPTFTGDPKAPTAAPGDSDTSIATTAFVQAALGALGASGARATKFAAALTGTASPETITHNLNTRDIQLTVLNGASPYTAVEVDWDATTVNTATIRYSPNLGAGYRVCIVG